MQDYAGNASHPNEFSRQLLFNLQNISGALPIIRAGGSTANRAIYYPNQTEAVILTFSEPGADQPSAMTIGPKWVESFQQFPSGTQYIYNLNFNDGESGLNQTVMEAESAFHGLSQSLYAYEIGNEVDGWPGSSRRPANWTLQDYVDQWLLYATAIGKDAIGSSLDQSLEPLFQGCAFEAPRKLEVSSIVWNVANAIRDGMARSHRLKTVSDHEYMGAACAGSPVPTLQGNLLNHYHMTSLMYYHEALGNMTAALGVPYVIGETNSISVRCQGTKGISDVFGAALWSVDYTLYASTLKVSRMHYHMGTPYRYSAWQPVSYNDTAASAKPIYYGSLFLSTAFAGGDKQVTSILNDTTLAAYAIYHSLSEEATNHNQSTLEAVAIINMVMYNATQPADQRPYTLFNLSSVGVQRSEAKVRRLTAPGVDSQDNIEFAGQSVNSKGQLVGSLTLEVISDGAVFVGAGEAVLVSL
ncbi:MAG: hypothetical protein M1821_002113 [Bathelium mastoideum]|nr:MAG: hypothetical protein M1821_002113 [Bathelium mastoideum]